MNRDGRFDGSTIRSSEEERCALTPSMGSVQPATPIECGEILDFTSVKWSWACRRLVNEKWGENYYLGSEQSNPRPGDVAVVRVEKIGHHHQIETENEQRLRLYPGDWLMCTFGNRYATDVYEGRVLGLKRLHLLTASGMIGTVVSCHRDVSRPTTLSFLGYVADPSGRRLNLKEQWFPPVCGRPPHPDVVLVVGTGMSTGKTTVTRKILRGLVSRGIRVAGCKLTGSVSPRDLHELRATGALHATDFSDYGFPSTYLASLTELIRLFDSMLVACCRKGAQLVVVELADGFLQTETEMLMGCEDIRSRVRGVVLAASCSGSALCAADMIQKAGLDLWVVSGLISNSPLFAREFRSRSSIPLASSRANANRLARLVMARIAATRPEERQTVMAGSNK